MEANHFGIPKREGPVLHMPYLPSTASTSSIGRNAWRLRTTFSQMPDDNFPHERGKRVSDLYRARTSAAARNGASKGLRRPFRCWTRRDPVRQRLVREARRRWPLYRQMSSPVIKPYKYKSAGLESKSADSKNKSMEHSEMRTQSRICRSSARHCPMATASARL